MKKLEISSGHSHRCGLDAPAGSLREISMRDVSGPFFFASVSCSGGEAEKKPEKKKSSGLELISDRGLRYFGNL